MQATDMAAVWQVQCACYSDLLEPESEMSLAAKRAASPETCFVALQQGQVCGYLIGMPWRFAEVPALNGAECQLPAQADCLYLHDMAIAPDLAGQGVGKLLFAAFRQSAVSLEFARLSLTAVGNAMSYWQQRGFTPHVLHLSDDKIAAYGGQVTYMYQEI